MDNVGVVERIAVTIFGHSLSFSLNMVLMTWGVMAVMIISALVSAKSLQRVPSKVQLVWEFAYGTFRNLSYEILGEKLGKKYAPLMVTLFVFVLLSNWFGMFPPIFQFLYIVFSWLHIPEALIGWLANMPAFEEPTKFLSTDLALGLMVAGMVHYEAIKAKGLKGYLASYSEPIFLFAPINIIGELGKVISHSFRLFGNVLGGSIIIVIISHLIRHIGLPPLLQGFFGLFSGSIQAFVFTMLAATYMAVAVDEG